MCYCCDSDARGQQHAAHRVPRRPASSSSLCIAFLFHSLFILIDLAHHSKREWGRDQTLRCAVCMQSEKNKKQTINKQAKTRLRCARRKQETCALRLSQLADASLVTRQIVSGPSHTSKPPSDSAVVARGTDDRFLRRQNPGG